MLCPECISGVQYLHHSASNLDVSNWTKKLKGLYMEMITRLPANLQNAMTKTTIAKCTPLRLPVPAIFASCWPRCEIERAHPTVIWYVFCRSWTLTLVVSVCKVDLLNVTTVSNRHIHRSTRIQIIVINSVHSFICMNLPSTQQEETAHLSRNNDYEVKYQSF